MTIQRTVRVAAKSCHIDDETGEFRYHITIQEPPLKPRPTPEAGGNTQLASGSRDTDGPTHYVYVSAEEYEAKALGQECTLTII